MAIHRLFTRQKKIRQAFPCSTFLIIVLLATAGSSNAEVVRPGKQSSPAQGFRLDLNRFDLYAGKGFPKEELFGLIKQRTNPGKMSRGQDSKQSPKRTPQKPVLEFDKKGWHKIPAVTSGRRMVKTEDIGFEGIDIPPFLSLKSYRAQEYTYVLPFEIDQASIDKLYHPALYLSSLGDNWEIYLNRHLIKKEMSYDPQTDKIHKHRRERGILLPFDRSHLHPGQNFLVFHFFAKPGSYYSGITMNSEMFVGNYPELEEDYSETLDFIFMFIYLIVGLYHLLLFLRRPKEKYNLYFALFSSGLFVYFITRSNGVFSLVENTLLITATELSTLFLLLGFMLLFIESFLTKKVSVFAKAYIAWALLLTTGIILFSFSYNAERFGSDLLIIWQLSMIFFLPYIFYRLLRSNIVNIKIYYKHFDKHSKVWRMGKAFLVNLGKTGAGNILLGSTLLIMAAIYDIIDATFLHTGITFAKYAFFAMVMGIAVSLANQFLNVYQRVEDLNASLEKKVEERTHELNESLEKVKLLKIQQDGDYFLTSLLVDPLNTNYANNQNILIDFYVEEKKKFKFRQWNKEIGGDVCLAHTVTLRGRAYSLFLNADAMGKSIQGAGGVLVLGSVLKSFIERTLMAPNEKNLFPEKWLRNVFVELQKIFETFDGSMLMSCVLGLADESNGFVYFINAEHPWAVLYRDGKAEFIENELTLRKLGTQIVDQKIWIQTFQMQPGDVLIMGSDGRDDLILSEDSDGIRDINEDETLILGHIERAEGKLEALVKEIKKTGSLSDDLSLLRLESRLSLRGTDENSDTLKSAQSIIKNGELKQGGNLLEENMPPEPSRRYWQLLIRTHLKLKNYEKVLDYCERFLLSYPDQGDYIYYGAFAAKQLKRYPTAADWAERYRLRFPQDSKNLNLLADTYRLSKQYDRAKQIVEESLAAQPNNETAMQLQSALAKNS